LYVWAQRKGLTLIGTGDVTHPGWFQEIRDQLEPAEDGLFRLKPDLAGAADEQVPPACRGPVRFILEGEISNIYKHNGVVRKVHNVVFCPTIEAAGKLQEKLSKIGNIHSDGRPILGISSKRLLEILLDIGEDNYLIPAHIWTPWFSMLGSKSGYDSLEDCFEDLSSHIFAVETGLSSDPAMNWRLSGLDHLNLVSNSDAHSASKLGREANEFDLDLSYTRLFESLKHKEDKGFIGTIEFYPEEGKYHLDGHRKCGTRLPPGETLKLGGICPVCGKKVTVGVMNRVESLADRPDGAMPKDAKPYSKLVPLPEIIGDALCVGSASKRVQTRYAELLAGLGPEFIVLRRAPREDIARIAGPVSAEAVIRARQGKVHIAPGYDGEFGKVSIFEPNERDRISGQQEMLAVLGATNRLKKFPKSKDQKGGDKKRTKSKRTAKTKKTAGQGKDEGHAIDEVTENRGQSNKPRDVPLEPIGIEVSRVLSNLNPEQTTAVTAPFGTLVIIAGPGTGKTRTLTHRIAYKVLKNKIDPGSILAVTFTNKAAKEMSQRLSALLGRHDDPEQDSWVKVVTFHALGLEIIKQNAGRLGLSSGFKLLSGDECGGLAAGAFGLPKNKTKAVLQRISISKRSNILSAKDADPQDLDLVHRFDNALKKENAIDLDDLIVLPVHLFLKHKDIGEKWSKRFKFIAVDEFQDLDPVQYELLKALSPIDGDLTVIGDPDQSIYGFRGADPGLFKRLLRERPGAFSITLNKCYRSTPAILKASGQMLEGDGEDGHNELVSFLAGGPRVKLKTAVSDRSEAEFVVHEIEKLIGGTSHFSIDSKRVEHDGDKSTTFGDVAVLFRLKAQARPLEEAFKRSGIPYLVVGEESALLKDFGQDLLKMLREATPAAESITAVAQALKSMDVDLESETARAWKSLARHNNNLAELLSTVCLNSGEYEYEPEAERVTLMTMHASKGLEFPIVFITGVEDGLVPYIRNSKHAKDEKRNNTNNTNNISMIEINALNEERRLLYVAMTRAKHMLYLVRAKKRMLFGEKRTAPPSRFLKDIKKALLEISRAVGKRGLHKRPGKGKDPQLSLL